MKLLIILSIEEYNEEVRKILNRQKVPVYSETKIHGYHVKEDNAELSSWFSGDKTGVYSRLFFSFQDEDCVERIFDEVKSFNNKMTTGSEIQNPIHAYMLDVQKKV